MNILGNFLNKTGKDKILILLLVGIILLVISIPTSKKSNSSLTSSGYDSILTDSEESDLEGKLKRCLAKVEGVGDVDVIVTYDFNIIFWKNKVYGKKYWNTEIYLTFYQ